MQETKAAQILTLGVKGKPKKPLHSLVSHIPSSLYPTRLFPLTFPLTLFLIVSSSAFHYYAIRFDFTTALCAFDAKWLHTEWRGYNSAESFPFSFERFRHTWLCVSTWFATARKYEITNRLSLLLLKFCTHFLKWAHSGSFAHVEGIKVIIDILFRCIQVYRVTAGVYFIVVSPVTKECYYKFSNGTHRNFFLSLHRCKYSCGQNLTGIKCISFSLD